MPKFWVVILLSALTSNYESLAQTKWSRTIRNPQGQLTRERRQFIFGDWIPLTQSCPTCRLFADPLDAGLRGENIGLTPPRPPAVTRQIHGEGNFFPQDESSILSVPPPPPSITSTSGNFHFSGFGQQFNSPLPVLSQKIVPQTQQIQFFPQTFLPNQQPLLVNGNQQILSGQSNLLVQGQSQQQINDGKAGSFHNSEFKTQKLQENVLLEQNKRPFASKQFSNKPQPFTPSQQNQQQAFVQQQTFGGQRNSILTPPPAPNNMSQGIIIPGLDKEEIQLLYVPVETLRQRGSPQEQLLTQQPQNIQFYNRPNGLQRPVNKIRPTEQTLVTQPTKGHFVTQSGNNQGQSDSTLKGTSAQPLSTTVTPSTLLLQHLPFQQTPQPFVSATPSTPTIQAFVTPASAFQKFSPFTPDTTLSHLSTVPNTIQFTQSDLDFGTTPKTILNQGVIEEEIINEKQQFSGLKNVGFSNQEQERPLQQPIQPSFVTQQQVLIQSPQQNVVFTPAQQKEIHAHNQFPSQIDQQQIILQKQQENQRLLQQQHQKKLEEQSFLEQQRKQKEQEEQRLVQQQRQKELEQQQLLLQKQKEVENQRQLEQQQRQKELEQQQLLLQKQKEVENQRQLEQQQRQKELEQQQLLLQKQKELEDQRRLEQQQRQKKLEQQQLLLQKQKELEYQRFLQQERQKELEEQKFLQEQRQKELEQQRRLQLQKQKEEEHQSLFRFQQQQRELEQQRLLQAQKEEQRLPYQQKLQNQINLKNQQQFQTFQQQKQNVPKQIFQQTNRHVLPENDQLNFIPQLEKELEPDDPQLVPHQPPLSVFFRGQNAAEAGITDVLRELRSSNSIIVLDQYFEKMPKVFVGPAGLIPPTGYEKFDLPYLSNLESNRIEKRIDKYPFFVAPLNFVPPPGYAKIPFPAPHVGSVVVSSESNPAMKLKSGKTEISQGSVEEENISGSFPVVGPELPGLINNLDTITTTVKPTTYSSTSSLPQTTAQLRNRRPSNSLYKPQSRKPVNRTRPSSTSKPEEVITQSIQKAEVTKDSEGIRKPFNRFLQRRRRPTKTTTESPLIQSQQEGKRLENRYYSVEVYHQEKNQIPRTQSKGDVIQQIQNDDQKNRQFEHSTSDNITPGGIEVSVVRPGSDYSRTYQNAGTTESKERHLDLSDYSDINSQTFEDGPLPTGSAKTITQELYRPNAISRPAESEMNHKTLLQPSSTSDKFQSVTHEDSATTKLDDTPDVSPTVAFVANKDTSSKEVVSVQSILNTKMEKYEKNDSIEPSSTLQTVTVLGNQQTKGFLDSNEQYTSAFAEISKHHHIPGFTDSSKRHPSTFPDVYPTSEIFTELQDPLPQEFNNSSEVRTTSSTAGFLNSKFLSTGSSSETDKTKFEGISQNQQSSISNLQVNPTAPSVTDGSYTTSSSVNSQAQNSAEINKNFDDELTNSFISLSGISSTVNFPQDYQQYFPSSTPQAMVTESYPVVVEQDHVSSTRATAAKINVHPSAETYTTGFATEEWAQHKDQKDVTESHRQDVLNNFPNDHRLKFPNPSIVRVRTRVRGKSRGQVNFAASQSTTAVPFTRSGVESRHYENAEQEYTTKTNYFRDHHTVKTSKYNQFRNVKKPLRTTTETTTEYEQKVNVYTIRPPRRPLSPSTVSTKRIRKPTTPLPSVEAATEALGISTEGFYSQSEHSDISPSGVSNDVYYEQSSLSSVKNKFRKHFDLAEQKSGVMPGPNPSEFPFTPAIYSTITHDESNVQDQEESNILKNLQHTEISQANSDKYPEWNPSESGLDVSGIVLTTIRTPGREDATKVEELKKLQDNKKAYDPDLEKKTGRRRIRVRVHKRPHENFETAESQNLRTVANILVPPTTTYKPSDESGFHQLAKNADFLFGGQKLFGLRSREYFKKRLNLTDSEVINKEEQSKEQASAVSESAEDLKISGFTRKSEKAQKNDFESAAAHSNETSEGNVTVRPKLRSFVRKIVKHEEAVKNRVLEANQLAGNEKSESKQGSEEFELRQPLGVSLRSFNYTGRANGTKHKTFVRYVKKNKVRQHETLSQVKSDSHELQKESKRVQPTIKSLVSVSEPQQTTEPQGTVDHKVEADKKPQTYQDAEEIGDAKSRQPETTGKPEIKQTPQPLYQVVEFEETSENTSQSHQDDQPHTSPSTSLTQTGLSLTQRPKFYQTLRPVFQRTSQTAFHRKVHADSTSSTTEQTIEESHEGRNGYPQSTYGKTPGFGTIGVEKTEEESKKLSEQQLNNRNLHALEVRKYLKNKSRKGGFSQLSRNKYFTSENVESETTVNTEKESEEPTTERNSETGSTESDSGEPKTTQVFFRTDLINSEGETTKSYVEFQPMTTEAISSSEEEGSEEKQSEVTSLVNFETTIETEAPTETPENVTTEGEETQRTEIQPDIYRFSENSFSFDETEKFTGTKNRAHVRNITTDIIENTASFSAPGVEKQPDIRLVTHNADEPLLAVNKSLKEKTEGAITEISVPETTTEYLETETTSIADAVTKSKVAKILKTSTTTKISHETEICYRGKCIRTKSENPDEDLKLLVDSASTMKIEKTKT